MALPEKRPKFWECLLPAKDFIPVWRILENAHEDEMCKHDLF